MHNSTPRHSNAFCVAIALFLFATSAFAQVRDFPVKPLRIVVPTSPGGILDFVARLLGPN